MKQSLVIICTKSVLKEQEVKDKESLLLYVLIQQPPIEVIFDGS
jgi:hypothetical protein